MRTRWPAKDPEEVLVCTFDFAAAIDDGEAISIAIVSSALEAGADPTPAAVLSGTPSISGGSVLQALQSGVVGASYAIRCVATLGPTGRVLVLAATLPIRRA
jgi:hypothetical protein